MSALAEPQVVSTEPAFLTRVRLRAERRVLWMRAKWPAAGAARALAITDDDVDQILADASGSSAAEADFYASDPAARELSRRIADADAAAAHGGPLLLLRRAFALRDADVDLLSLCVAVELDPMLRRVCGYLHDDANLGGATPWLAMMLFGHPHAAFGPDSPLVGARLASPETGRTSTLAMTLATPWSADAFAIAAVLHGQVHDPLVAQAITRVEVAEAAAAADLYPRELEAAERFARSIPRRGVATEIEFVAGAGQGRRTLAAQLCARLGAQMILVDGSALATSEGITAHERMTRVARFALLARAIPCFHSAEHLTVREWTALDTFCDTVLLIGETPRPRSRSMAARKTIVLPPLAREQRRALWEQLTDTAAPETIVQWALTPGEIVSIAAVAAAGEAETAAAARDIVRSAPGELFAPLACSYTWDDIVLSSAVRRHLAELEGQARLRFSVLEEWGLSRVHPMSRGVTALFAGPSGTGKTMAAQVLARSLGMDLYRVDLAGVVNKYIGETEKRLKAVFDACERAEAILFFDEADALFGQRTQVRDAHDRYANIEIDYLLQRMEQFEGIAILATNRRSDLDKAFVRRLRFIIDFVQPSPAERLELWRRVMPETTPAGEPLLEGLDFELLAQRLAMTGADIKAAALSAAFLARAEGTRIGMRHVLAAARREMTKHGIEVRDGDLENLR